MHGVCVNSGKGVLILENFSSLKITIGNTGFTILSQGSSNATDDMWNAEPHLHPFIEMHLVSCGKAIIKTTSRKFMMSESDVCIIPPNCYHSVESLSPTVLKVSILLEMTKITNEAPDTYSVYKKIANNTEPYLLKCSPHYVTDIFNVIQNQEKYGVTTSNRICFLLSLILCEIYDANEFVTTQNINGDSSDYRMELLIEIQDRLNTMLLSREKEGIDLSFDKLAKHLNLTTTQLRRLIRKHFNRTYRELVLEYKIERAKNIIDNQNISLEKTAEICGYSTYAGFYKAFLCVTGMTPEEYRYKTKDNKNRA